MPVGSCTRFLAPCAASASVMVSEAVISRPAGGVDLLELELEATAARRAPAAAAEHLLEDVLEAAEPPPAAPAAARRRAEILPAR